MKSIRKYLASLLFIILASCTARQEQPNIILIMADDMGFSDIGSYG